MPAPLSHPDVAVDLVVLTIRENQLCFLAIERGIEPFKGELALPGGFVLPDEDLHEAAERELREETGISGMAPFLEQLETFGKPSRDPRRRIFSVAYLALPPNAGSPQGGSDAASSTWLPVNAPRNRLAFDHETILEHGIERARAKLEYTPLARSFCAEEFSIGDLRRVYEAVWGVELDRANFHRKVTTAEGFIEPTGGPPRNGKGRPAQLYRSGPEVRELRPPLMRPRN
jgi:8-oxo-dGTP diphosphatase